MSKTPCIVMAGPTATGKSEAAIEIAKTLGGEIVSADSMQVYRKMDIGTAKITKEEMQGIRHHLIDILDPKEDFNVFIFRELAMKAIEEIASRGHIPILTGGTGFYIQSVIKDIDFTETTSHDDYRDSLIELAEKEGNEALHKMLEKRDLEAANKIHPNDRKRLIRALEFFTFTGEKISSHNEAQERKKGELPCLYIVLNDDRQVLYERINRRVDRMFEQGLTQEVTGLYREGLREENISMKGIGYREFFPYFKGESTLDEVRERIKTDTRHFAKRQVTWFKREEEAVWMDRREYPKADMIGQKVTELYRKKFADTY